MQCANNDILHKEAGILKKISRIYSENHGFCVILSSNIEKLRLKGNVKFHLAAPCDTP